MLKLFNKDLKLFFHDQRSVIFTFLLPLILITVFAFAYGGTGKYDGRSRPVSLLVADLDLTVASKEIISNIDSLQDISIVISDSVKSKELVIKGRYVAALIIHKGFQDSLEAGTGTPMELVYDRSREMETGIIQQSLIRTVIASTSNIIVRNRIESYLKEQFPVFGQNMSDNIFRTVTGDGNHTPAIKYTSVVGVKNDTKLGLIQAVAGTAILMLLFSVAGVGTSILEEKENGTINRLLYSPLKGSAILYGKMLFAFFISILQLTTMFLFAWLVFNMDMNVNVAGLILLVISTSFAVSSMGIFLAAIAKTRQQAHNLSTIVILVMSAVGW